MKEVFTSAILLRAPLGLLAILALIGPASAAWRNVCPDEYLCSNSIPAGAVQYRDGQLFDLVSPSAFSTGAVTVFARDPASVPLDPPIATRYAQAITVMQSWSSRPIWHSYVMPGHSVFHRSDGDTLIVGGASATIVTANGVPVSATQFYTDPTRKAESYPASSLVKIDSRLYMAGGPGVSIFRTEDDGVSWSKRSVSAVMHRGDALYSAPNGTALWSVGYYSVLQDGMIDFRSTLFESTDEGSTWQFLPGQASLDALGAQIAHIAIHGDQIYAATHKGIVVSQNAARTWSMLYPTPGPVHTVAVATDGRGDLLLAGTDSGIIASRDGGATWTSFSKGLYGVPHRVYFVNRLLLAGSEAGWYLCEDLSCEGSASYAPPVAERGERAVVEFYHAALDHFFITADAAEAAAVDAGWAGPGWARTGFGFTVWSPMGNPMAKDVCRFYGSMSPGPNSHFYSGSSAECDMLHRWQQATPATAPRWNFEALVFMAQPIDPATGLCRSGTRPVFRAYNNGYARGIDSNHRYVVDHAEIAKLMARGWVDEGIAFCAKSNLSGPSAFRIAHQGNILHLWASIDSN